MHTTKWTTTAAAAVGGALLLAACSSGGGGSAEASKDSRVDARREQATAEANFCRGAKKLYTEFRSGGQTAENGQDLFETARALEAPTAIEADWQITLDALEPLVDPTVKPEVDLQTAQETGVLDRVGTYISTTCGIG
jgi:hypothetical protein